MKGLAAVPVLGALAWESNFFYQKSKYKNKGLSFQFSPLKKLKASRSRTIRLGFIGTGIRGKYLLEGLGFVHPDTIDRWRREEKENPKKNRYSRFMEQGDLNVEIAAVCDVFDVRAQLAIETGANRYRNGKGEKMAPKPKRYAHYKELLRDSTIDAVVIATPDHWHGTMVIEAAKHSKHIYVEKPVTWQLEETYRVRRAVKKSGITFQLGHQNRQIEAYDQARQLVERGALGHVSLIEVTTNRNSPNGAWVYPIHPNASSQTIDWQQFLGPAPRHAFSRERFFRWRCWWDYSTGLIGDLFTHEYDCINQIFSAGIPSSATASGGIYHFKDGRTVPDTLQVTLEFADKNMSMLYSASQANSLNRGKTLMGTEASIKLGRGLELYVDNNSKKYKEAIRSKRVSPDKPAYLFDPSRGLDGMSSPTEKYFADRGLLDTTRKGKSVSTTFLHMEEWLDAIRLKKDTSCNIDRAFEEGISTHMATMAFKEKRTVFWDKEKEVIV
ncbi:MAG: Gfo/Idh/MocA family oxidoreductase [Cytophagales bacterium]|nr:Gfo/Idh/MocA family oxidoreductase [Cytophagales bacterium]